MYIHFACDVNTYKIFLKEIPESKEWEEVIHYLDVLKTVEII